MSCDPTANGFQFTENYAVGPGGEELTMLDGNNNWQRTNVYAGGRMLATYDLVVNPAYALGNGQPAQIAALHFHLEDPLGTRRMQVSGNLANLGQPETDIQSLPFGDQLNSFPDQYAPATADDSTPSTSPRKSVTPSPATTTLMQDTTVHQWGGSCPPIRRVSTTQIRVIHRA